MGRGITQTEVLIGIASSDVDTYAKTLGLSVATGDTKAQVNAIVRDINHRGGLLGRQIRLVWYKASTADELNNPQIVDQAACAAWTQDSHVFAVVGPGGVAVDNLLLACLAKANTPLIGVANPWELDGLPIYQGIYETNPNFFNIGAILGETWDRVVMARLVARNFFQSWDTLKGMRGTAPMRLGMILPDTPDGNYALNSIRGQLARYGIKPWDVVRTSGDLSQRTSQAQSAELQFRTEGITHVFGASLPFMTTANGQHYYPRYLIPLTAATYSATAPADELRGSMGESYLPALDVNQAQSPGPPTAATTHCEKLMAAAGETPTYGNTSWVMDSFCDGFYFLQAAISRSGSLSNRGLQQGLDSLGSTFPSAVTWTTNLGPGHHASVETVRDLEYHSSSGGCGCFEYVSKRDFQ